MRRKDTRIHRLFHTHAIFIPVFTHRSKNRVNGVTVVRMTYPINNKAFKIMRTFFFLNHLRKMIKFVLKIKLIRNTKFSQKWATVLGSILYIIHTLTCTFFIFLFLFLGFLKTKNISCWLPPKSGVTIFHWLLQLFFLHFYRHSLKTKTNEKNGKK